MRQIPCYAAFGNLQVMQNRNMRLEMKGGEVMTEGEEENYKMRTRQGKNKNNTP